MRVRPWQPPAPPDDPAVDPRCGSSAGYWAHRRNGTPKCRPCLDAQAAWQRSYEARRYLNRGRLRVDATGTARRLRALAAMGWSSIVLAERLGISQNNVSRLYRQREVQAETAARVAALYDELWMLPGPSEPARRTAMAKGWPSPLAWDDESIDNPAARPLTGRGHHLAAFDEIAVQRAMHGDSVHLRPAERTEVTRRLTALGYSAAEIAERLHTTKRSVQRRRSAGRRSA